MPAVIFFAVIGVVTTVVASAVIIHRLWMSLFRSSPLPAATAREVATARRRNRADLSSVRAKDAHDKSHREVGCAMHTFCSICDVGVPPSGAGQ